jgi:predicted lactoylglutathione lyase
MSSAAYRAGREVSQGPVVIWLNLSNRAEVDTLHDRWLAAGVSVAVPIAAQPYKLYEFIAQDLDDNLLRVFYDFAWEERETGRAADGLSVPDRL